MKHFLLNVLTTTVLLSITACSNPQPGPDKTLSGAVLGAGWGAGAGGVIGHQVGNAGGGAAIGAGFGLAEGALIGGGFDLTESALLKQQDQLTTMEAINAANRAQLGTIIQTLDNAASTPSGSGIYQVFFDPDATGLQAGAVANLQVIADSIRKSPRAYEVYVVGHTDDTGNIKHNESLAQARARTVSGYLASRGISVDQITVKSYGSKQPLATNKTPAGRQLNRRVDVYISPDK